MEIKIDNSLGEILYDEPMKDHTSFRVGGPAKVFITPKDEKALIEIIKICKKNDYKYYILGSASNILVHDEGFDGVIISLCHSLNEIKYIDGLIYAEAGAKLKDVSDFAYERSLTGLEFSHGIPGSIGGGVIMNAGAYDSEMKNVVYSVRLLDENENIIELSNEEMKFGYRKSLAQEKKYVVLGAYFKLEKGVKEEIFAKFSEFDKRRSEKQPLDMPSAGSTFKRPEGYFAGKLIDDSGLRGFTHRGAMISNKHCGFVVNYNNAKCSDIIELIETVQKIVFDNFGVKLEREVKIIGE